ncbi:ABC-type branched-subunit amino acid transport system substrate-binding protein [Rhodoligotrophos appendicifer]|uniref:ABC transporter substrate-binding protein n=1 Tax=Rhodoligotrophos appendicifer TaxID=987056 RepID=UPI0014797906|nr:ABC transporter substrate-binding protein [Rhodoligotrophos appendicifer]
MNAIRFTSQRRVLAAAILAASLPMAPAIAQEAPAKIGLFLELTGGSASTTSEASQLGVELAISEINAAGGIGGRKLQMVVADTQTDATVGVGEMKRLVLQDEVDFVFGPVISQVFMAAAPVVNEAKVSSIGSTGSMAITPTFAPYYFSTLINAEVQAKKMVSQAVDVRKAKKVAILSDTGAQAKDFVAAVKKELEARGVELTGTQEYQYRATDMTPQFLALRRSEPEELLFFTSSGEDGGHALKSLSELGWDIHVTGNWSIGAFAEIVEQIAGKEAMKNVTGANYRGFTYCKGGEQPTAFLDLVAKAKTFAPDRAARASMTFVALFYDATYLMKAAVEGTGNKWEGPAIAAWIEKNAGSVKGVTGVYTPSATSHFLYDANAVVTVIPSERGEANIQERADCS